MSAPFIGHDDTSTSTAVLVRAVHATAARRCRCGLPDKLQQGPGKRTNAFLNRLMAQPRGTSAPIRIRSLQDGRLQKHRYRIFISDAVRAKVELASVRSRAQIGSDGADH